MIVTLARIGNSLTRLYKNGVGALQTREAVDGLVITMNSFKARRDIRRSLKVAGT